MAEEIRSHQEESGITSKLGVPHTTFEEHSIDAETCKQYCGCPVCGQTVLLLTGGMCPNCGTPVTPG